MEDDGIPEKLLVEVDSVCEQGTNDGRADGGWESTKPVSEGSNNGRRTEDESQPKVSEKVKRVPFRSLGRNCAKPCENRALLLTQNQIGARVLLVVVSHRLSEFGFRQPKSEFRY
jgi:hypothetical protein